MLQVLFSGKPAALEDHTNPDWLPSLYLGYSRRSDKQIQAMGDRWVKKKAKAKAAAVPDFLYQFNISVSIMSRILLQRLTIMDIKLIKWHEREVLWASTPACYRTAFGKNRLF